MPYLAPITSAHADLIAVIHHSSLPEDFLPTLGLSFLKTMYRGMLDLDLAWGWVAQENGDTVGFVIAGTDTAGLFRRLAMGRFAALAWHVSLALLQRPRLIAPTLETFFYPRKEGPEAPAAELLVIAVRDDHRNQRIGRELVAQVDQGMRNRSIRSYKVTVLERNRGANRFYRQLGFTQTHQFRLYGKTWNLYQKTL